MADLNFKLFAIDIFICNMSTSNGFGAEAGIHSHTRVFDRTWHSQHVHSKLNCLFFYVVRPCLLQMLCTTSSTSNQLPQEEVWTYQQHPSKEEVKVDKVQLGGAVESQHFCQKMLNF